MHPLSRQLAVAKASGDGQARIIGGAETLYLATPAGEVWRVLDANQPDGEPCVPPSSDPNVWARVFIGDGADPMVRVYRFSASERRSTCAGALHQQFLSSSDVYGADEANPVAPARWRSRSGGARHAAILV